MRKLLLLMTLAAALGTPGAATAAAPSIVVRASSYGPVLFDGQGFVLYAFTKDPKGGSSTCYDDCATAWPPYIVKAKPRAFGAARRALVGTIRRTDGTLQATYAGRPVYYYVGDREPGQIRCQNEPEFGGIWLILRASGALVR